MTKERILLLVLSVTLAQAEAHLGRESVHGCDGTRADALAVDGEFVISSRGGIRGSGGGTRNKRARSNAARDEHGPNINRVS